MKKRLCILFLIPLLLFSCGKEKEPFTHFDVGNGWLQAVEGETEQIYFASIEHRLCIWEDECVTVLTENAWNPVYGDGQLYFFSGKDLQQYDPENNQKNTIYTLNEDENYSDIWYYNGKLYLMMPPYFNTAVRQINPATYTAADIPLSVNSTPEDMFYPFGVTNDELYGIDCADKQFYAINYTNGTKRSALRFSQIKGIRNDKLVTYIEEDQFQKPVLYDPNTETYQFMTDLPKIEENKEYSILAVTQDAIYLRIDNSLYTYRNGKMEKALNFGKGIYEYRSYDLAGDTLLIACVGVRKDDTIAKEFIDLTTEEDLDSQRGNTTITICAVKPDGQVYILLKEKQEIWCGNSYG